MHKKAIIIIFILAFVGSIYVSAQQAAVPVNVSSGSLRIGENAIFISDQKPANTVAVGFAYLADSGYVAIHQIKSDGSPGVFLGTSGVLSRGETSSFFIGLSRRSINGEELLAMLHRDNGDGAFDAAQDLPVKDTGGNVIMMKFLVSDTAEQPGAVSF